MKKVGILGATGYVGEELSRLLYRHPKVELVGLASHSYVGRKYSEVYPHFYQEIDFECVAQMIDTLDVDILFCALPHGIVSKILEAKHLKYMKIIDMGADFRITKEAYDKWYKVQHFGEDLMVEAVYGLSEWNREQIKKASLIANPGCYVTCSLLSLIPLIKEGLIDTKSIIIDAKSGVTGAGRELNLGTHFTECNESIKAYGIGTHRHTPEIEETLFNLTGEAVTLSFTPHLVPMNRGILTTIYSQLKEEVDAKKIRDAYKRYYKDEKFIRLLEDGTLAESRWVKGSNYCDISFKIDERTNRLVVVSCIDNMMKGAASQGIQNMNLMMGWDETLGIDMLPIFPV